MSDPLLAVRDLEVSFASGGQRLPAVEGLSFSLSAGEILALVGESGSGKTVTALSLMGLLPASAHVRGTVRLGELELIGASEPELRAVRGVQVAMVFQDPMTALNPVHRVGHQIEEQLRAHQPLSPAAARERAIELLERVGIPRARERARAYPHELSGGMRQRVVVAMALSCNPRVLIADEPTTALDVTIQAQILSLIGELRDETGMAVILVTHDLGVVAEVADRVAVMYAGRIVETGTLDRVFLDPQHPYTWGLLGSITRVDRERPHRLPAIPGTPPPLHNKPEGCHFRGRCPHEFEACTKVPELERRGGEPGHEDRCWLDPKRKREARVVEGQIGLAAEVKA